MLFSTGFATFLPHTFDGKATAAGDTGVASTAGAPYGVHLSYTQDPTSTLTAAWFTEGSEDPGTVVEWGPAPDQLIHSANGTTDKVPEADILTHVATMTDLTPGQDVYYRVGGASGFTKVFQAKTHPPEGEPFTIAHFGDQGTTDAAEDLTKDLVEADPDLVVVAGDLAYAEEDWWEWDVWYRMNEPLFATRPVMTALGNHEGSDGGPFGTEPYVVRQAMPEPEYYYSFDFRNVHFLMISSDSTARSDGIFQDQLEFMEQDLKNATQRREAGEIDFIVVVHHHPLYGNQDSLGRQFNRQTIWWEEQFLDRYQVDMVWAGHNHHYERSYPMMGTVPTTTEDHDYVDPAGWIQVISGGGGKSLYTFQHPDDFYPHAAEWARRYHYSTYDVDGPTLDHEAISTFFLPGEQLGHFSLTSARGAEDAGRTQAAPVVAR